MFTAPALYGIHLAKQYRTADIHAARDYHLAREARPAAPRRGLLVKVVKTSISTVAAIIVSSPRPRGHAPG